MSKRKLTQNQTRRIQSNNAKALHRHKKKEVEWQDDMLGESQDGVVVTRYSVHADVENAQGEIFRCNLRRTLSSLVVGDKVIWRQGNEQLQGVSGVIEAIHPRQNEIARPDYYDGLKPIAANIDRIIIVSAVVPVLSLNIIDRYLVVCENAGIEPVIVVNKGDLLDAEQEQKVESQLQIYRDIGYQTIIISAETGKNMEKLTALSWLFAHVAIFCTVLMTIAVFLVIGNSIRSDVYSSRASIDVMKLLGATDQFILRPYLYTGMIYAVLGGLVAALFSSLIVGYFTSAVKYVTDIFAVTFELNGLGVGELIFLLVSCLIMGYVGAWIAATRHIAMLDNKL